MRSRPFSTFFIIFLIVILFSFMSIIVYEAYSVYMEVSSVEPLPRRTSIQYYLSKQGSSSSYTEVRSVELRTSGATITSANIGWYRRFRILFGYYVTVSIYLKDDNGNTLSSGSVTDCFIGSGSVNTFIDFADVNIDSLAKVEAYANIGDVCWESPWPLREPFLEEPENYLEEEIQT